MFKNKKRGFLNLGIFSRLFKSKSKEDSLNNTNSIQILNSESSFFTSIVSDPYSDSTFRSATHVIASHASKFLPTHVVKNGEANKKLNHVLQKSPNKIMTIHDLLYKSVTHLMIHNNAYIYIERNNVGQVVGLYPIDTTSVQFGYDSDNDIWVKFYLKNGKEYVLPYSDIIHIRRHFNSNTLLGDSNHPIYSTVHTSQTQEKGIEKSIQLSNGIRGVLDFKTLVNKQSMKETLEEFKRDFLDLNSSSGGVVVTDNTYKYEPIESKPLPVDSEQLKYIEDKIFNYLGVNRNIVSGNYTEAEFQAFYENTLEALSVSFSSEFTKKIFTDIELEFGNEIIFESKRLNFSNMQTRINMIAQIQQFGIMTLNESRELLNLPLLPSEEGDVRLQSLNYIESDVAKEYQLDLMKNGNLKVDNKLKSNNVDNESEGDNEGN